MIDAALQMASSVDNTRALVDILSSRIDSLERQLGFSNGEQQSTADQLVGGNGGNGGGGVRRTPTRAGRTRP